MSQIFANFYFVILMQINSDGRMLLHAVMKDLNLLESDYFGLLFSDKEGNEIFLDPVKKIRDQIPG